MARLTGIHPNVSAFLDMIAESEGTHDLGDDGYNVLVGGKLFDSYSDHPRRVIVVNRRGLRSSAAGRYQILQRTFDGLQRQLGTKGFRPEVQDENKIETLREAYLDSGGELA